MADGVSNPEPVPENGAKVEGGAPDGFDAESGRRDTAEYDAIADGEIERQLVRKLDWNLVPLVMAICERLPGSCSTR
jgi:hypothetical protein